MKSRYSSVRKELEVEFSLDRNRRYLVFSWVAIEWVAINMIGMDLSGFAAQQMNDLQQYESMLIELGERPYSTWSNNFPIELRIVGTTLFSACLFFIIKTASKNNNNNMGMILNMLFGNYVPRPPSESKAPEPQQEEAPKKSKMRGPSHDPDKDKAKSD